MYSVLWEGFGYIEKINHACNIWEGDWKQHRALWGRVWESLREPSSCVARASQHVDSYSTARRSQRHPETQKICSICPPSLFLGPTYHSAHWVSDIELHITPSRPERWVPFSLSTQRVYKMCPNNIANKYLYWYLANSEMLSKKDDFNWVCVQEKDREAKAYSEDWVTSRATNYCKVNLSFWLSTFHSTTQ